MERVELVTTWHGAKWREYEQPTHAMPSSSEPELIADRIVSVLGARAMTQSQIRDRVHAGVEKTREALQRLLAAGVLETESGRVGQTLYRVAQ